MTAQKASSPTYLVDELKTFAASIDRNGLVESMAGVVGEFRPRRSGACRSTKLNASYSRRAATTAARGGEQDADERVLDLLHEDQQQR